MYAVYVDCVVVCCSCFAIRSYVAVFSWYTVLLLVLLFAMLLLSLSLSDTVRARVWGYAGVQWRVV